ncbi:MAG: hypothetical protein KJO79_07775 [Verrucomicrobiae bacterium]|nr:hypothetical protein [Verrucomicrobiae bacterium]NNJ87062.1 hypothetical protein [Akkermansiaceae bacterium]
MEHLDGQVILLIIFVVISALKWLYEKIKGEQPHETPEELEDIYEDFREEIRQRQTEVQQPPAPPSPPPLPPSARPTQQVSAASTQQVAQAQSTPRFQRPKKRTLSAEEKAAAARFQQLSSGSRQRKSSPKNSVRELLSNPLSTRQAIILTEILGKPKSLRDA